MNAADKVLSPQHFGRDLAVIQIQINWAVVFATPDHFWFAILYWQRFVLSEYTLVNVEPFSHRTGTLWCLQKEMATYRHWSVSSSRDPDDVSRCRILSPDKTEWRLISATLCGWGRCFVADQLWFIHYMHTRRRWRRRMLTLSHYIEWLLVLGARYKYSFLLTYLLTYILYITLN